MPSARAGQTVCPSAPASQGCDPLLPIALFAFGCMAILVVVFLFFEVQRLERLCAQQQLLKEPTLSRSTSIQKDDAKPETIPERIDGSSSALSSIDAYLIDLDGTIYSPSGPIEGAAEFYAAVLRHKPHVFLSNTGAKGADGVRSKLARNGIIMGPRSQSLHIHTAAQAQVRYMVDVIPSGARVFVIAGGDADGPGSYWMKLLREQSADLVSSWWLRTHLTDKLAREWAAAAAAGQPVYVVLFSDGSISSVTDPTTGEAGFADWNYDVIKKTSFVLAHGAELIATAEDAFNPSQDNMPLPGPGMFCAMFRKLLGPIGEKRLHICGKGGSVGSQYMMERALGMLREQGFKGDASKVMIVGDRFDTDILGGAMSGIKTCLVESGCHAVSMQKHFPEAKADFVASSIAELIPPERRRAGRWRRISFDHCQRVVQPAPLPPLPTTPPLSPDALMPHRSTTTGPVVVESQRPPAVAKMPSVVRQPSDSFSHASSALRAWQLGHGNLVYSAGTQTLQGGPLILRLRSFFEEHAAKDFSDGPSSSGTISAADAMEAMRALGISPPARTDGRGIVRFPFEVSDGTRVTYAKLCQEVLRALEATGGRRHTVFEQAPKVVRQTSSGGSSPSSRASQAEEAPAVLQSLPSSKMIMPTVLSETALDALTSQYERQQTEPTTREAAQEWVERPLAHAPPSRQVKALVDRRFLYLGREISGGF